MSTLSLIPLVHLNLKNFWHIFGTRVMHFCQLLPILSSLVLFAYVTDEGHRCDRNVLLFTCKNFLISVNAKFLFLHHAWLRPRYFLTLAPIGHVRYINILAWLRGFRVKIANFSSFFCLSIPKGDLDAKKTTPNIEVWPESLGAMLVYWYIERGLLFLRNLTAHANHMSRHATSARAKY